MRYSAPSPFIALTVMATQLLGPVVLWAAEQRGIRVDANRQIVVSALSGNQLTADTKGLQFRETVAEGATLTTGPATTAELLVGNRAVVTLGHGTTARVRTVSADQATIQVTNGLVRVAAAASAVGPQGLITVQTPTSQVQTRGGIVRVLVDTPVGKVEHGPNGAQAYRVSYASGPLLAAVSPSSDLIHVEEGTAEIPGVGPSGGLLTVQAGQRVMVQAGRAGVLAEVGNLGIGTTGILATTSHTLTPKEGREYLVALQVDQATKLGQALTGAAETTGQGESDKKSDTKNVINGATGGVLLSNNSSGGNPGGGNPSGGNSGNNNIVSILFGSGNTANPAATTPQNRDGGGFGGNNNAGGFVSSLACNNSANCNVTTKGNGGNTLLVFTRKDPVEPFVKEDISLPEARVDSNIQNEITYELENVPEPTEPPTPPEPLPTIPWLKNTRCGEGCLASHYYDALDPKHESAKVKVDPKNIPEPVNVGFRALDSSLSKFTVAKELVLIGGAANTAHGGVPPTERLIVRGASSSTTPFTNLARNDLDNVDGLFPTDSDPADIGNFAPIPRQIIAANSTFVVETPTTRIQNEIFVGGTLGQYSNDPTPSPNGRVIEDDGGNGGSFVDGAITATGSNVLLKGGVILDQETTATIGTTSATNGYFTDRSTDLGRKFSGSLLSVIRGPQNTPTMLTIQDRMLGVYDGSTINTNGGNKALLSVLDARLKGPGLSIPLIDIAAGTHFDRNGNATPGKQPNVTVTSALVTRSTLPLDGALLEASAPLFAFTQATMTTTNHFADLAGNQAQSMKLGDALVALNASKLIINNGHLLNLNNATAAISGYLFSLTSGSQLDIKNGALFSLSNNSSLTLNGNAFGAFGGGSNTVTIENNLCTGPCGRLVNSASEPILLDGVPLKVSGVTQDVVLPNGFNAFALAPGATGSNTKIDIDANDALFHIDPTSTLTINGTKVK